jgi:hypothetical protein
MSQGWGKDAGDQDYFWQGGDRGWEDVEGD